jgi:hypothetical protein
VASIEYLCPPGAGTRQTSAPDCDWQIDLPDDVWPCEHDAVNPISATAASRTERRARPRTPTILAAIAGPPLLIGLPPASRDTAPMPRLVDTLNGFEVFARKAALETPYLRESLWKEEYEAKYPEVFEAFYSTHGSPSGRAAIVRELSRVRQRVEEAAPIVREAIKNTESRLPELLHLPPEPSPRHVLMVGTFTVNAAVGRLGDDVAVFHCLEWFQTADGARALVAHETTHAWHELALGTPLPEDDAAWMAFSEGVAIEASRMIVPDRAELDYYWYGHGEVENWLEWCKSHHTELIDHFRASLDVPETVETYFGGGMIEGQWRVGFYLADELVRSLELPLDELVRMSVEEGRSAIRQALGVEPTEPREGAH